MAANIVVIRDEKEWEFIENLLNKLGEGGIIVPPEKVEHLDENFPGWEDHIDEPLDYDFGGDPDVWIDIARDDNYAEGTIDDYLIEKQHEQAD